MYEDLENASLRKQIVDAAQRSNIQLTDTMINQIIAESYFLRETGENGTLHRISGTMVDSIKVYKRKNNGEIDQVAVSYSTNEASFKNNLNDFIDNCLAEEYYLSSEEDKTFEEYFKGNSIIDSWDRINEIMDGVDDVNMNEYLYARIDEYGCSGSNIRTESEIARKQFIKNIGEQKGIYAKVMFLLLEDKINLYCLGEHDYDAFDLEYDEGEYYNRLRKRNIEEVLNSICEHFSDNRIDAIRQFLDGIDSSLSEEEKALIMEYNLEKEFETMVHNEEIREAVPGHPQITISDIRQASRGLENEIE